MYNIKFHNIYFQPNCVAEVFNKQRRTKFNFIFAAYYHALQLYTNDNTLASKSIADVYSAEPKQILTYMLKRFGNEDELAKHESGRCLITNLTNLSDLLQAHMLQDLDKGMYDSLSSELGVIYCILVLVAYFFIL